MKKIVLNDDLKTKLQNILDKHKTYKGFSKNKKNAYEYSKLINEIIIFCPYCNLQSIETIERPETVGGERPDYDHFILQNGDSANDLSCSNLVPCCKQCNQNYKGAKPVDKKILNPFIDDFDSLAKFILDINTKSVDNLSNNEILIDVITEDKNLKSKTNKTIKLFNLLRRYNSKTAKRDLEPFFDNLEAYPDIKRKEIENLTKTEKKVLDYVYNTKDIDINKNRYGKFKRDIINNYIVEQNG